LITVHFGARLILLFVVFAPLPFPLGRIFLKLVGVKLNN